MEAGKKEIAKEASAFYDWMDELRFAKYYGLTCESDTDSHMMQMMNLWYLRFSDEQTFDYYFLVNASLPARFITQRSIICLLIVEADDSWTESTQRYEQPLQEVFYRTGIYGAVCTGSIVIIIMQMIV